MRLLPMLLCLFLAASRARGDASSDSGELEDTVLLWKSLFSRLDHIVKEVELVKQKQENQEIRLSKLIDNIGNLTSQPSISQQMLESRLSKIIENLQDLRLEQVSRHETLHSQCAKISENVKDLRLEQPISERILNGSIANLLTNVNQVKTYDLVSRDWLTIQRRQSDQVSFQRNWQEYKTGFGHPDGDYFIGLERLHKITSSGIPHELWIVLVDFENYTRYAWYDNFRIGSESQYYALMELGAYSGDAGDGMRHHRGHPFTTSDRDNSKGSIRGCADNFKGGWWYYDPCYIGNLNGPYRAESAQNNWGISWGPWRGWNVSMRFAAMYIRPKV